MMKRALLLCLALVGLLAAMQPAVAVTHGELDGDGHPYVGLMVAQDGDGQPLWRCSGTLIAPEVFLTAGHCTEAPAEQAQIWFDADVESGLADNGYPFSGDVGGTTHTHPDYDPNAFYVRDLGLVLLDAPMELDTYGALPELNQLDGLKPRRSTTFTAVGYGLQRASASPQEFLLQADRIRMTSEPQLLQINTAFTGDFSILLSNNANTGGTCFGDSGGPNFLGDSTVVAGVTSFGLNPNCGGTGGVFRVDRSWSLEWIEATAGDLLTTD